MSAATTTSWRSRLARRLDVGMEHADAQLARVLLVGRVQQRRYIRLVDRDLYFGHLARSELRGGQRDLPEQLLASVERELIDDLSPSAHLHLLRLRKDIRGMVDVEIEQAVLFRVLERKRRRLFRPLPFDGGVVLGILRGMPAVLRHDEHILRLRLELKLRHLIGALTRVLASQWETSLVLQGIETDLDDRVADIR